jgi:hypothetical protein
VAVFYPFGHPTPYAYRFRWRVHEIDSIPDFLSPTGPGSGVYSGDMLDAMTRTILAEADQNRRPPEWIAGFIRLANAVMLKVSH